MSLPQFYSLAATVKASAFFADCPLSKTAIAHTLSTSRPTVKRLESIAFSHIPDFRQDYPEYPKAEWLMRKSKYNREVLLTPFQTWIVSLLKTCMEHLKKKTAVESFILANAYLFTRETFRKELQKLAQLSAKAADKIMLLSQLCTELELKEDDARMILADVRDDFADCEDVTNEEAKLIRNSIKAALPGGTGEVPLEPGLEVSTQRTLVSNVSQVLGIPLFLAIEAELNAIATIEDVKNHLILNTLDQKQAELDQAIRKRSASRQQGYYTALKDLAQTMQKPLVVVEDMQQDIQQQNQQLEELLDAVKAGESFSPETAIS